MNNLLKRSLALILSLVMILPTSIFTNEVKAHGDEVMKSTPVKSLISDLDLSKRSIDFNDGWKFHYGDEGNAQTQSFDDSGWKEVNIPHDYSLELDYSTSGEAESGYKLGGIGWYRKSFPVDEVLRDKKVFIEFGGVYNNATIYVNGQKVGFHPYGYTPFSYDISKYLKLGQDNILAVKVNHEFPSSRWYSGSGIYRDVSLLVTDKLHIEKYGVKITAPNLETQRGNSVSTKIITNVLNESGEDKNVQVKQEIIESDTNTTVSSKESETINIKANSSYKYEIMQDVSNPKLWSIESPYLYKVVSSVMVDGEVVDKVSNDFGYRTIKMDPDKGFFLNGQAVKLKGVCMHHDQGSLGAASHYRAVERQVEILQQMGANAIRVTHNPASDQLIEIANRKGILLIEEAFDTWTSYKNGNRNDHGRWFNTQIEDDNPIIGKTSSEMTWAEHDIKTMVRRGQNSPAIVMWSTGNEVMENIMGSRSNYPQIIKKLIGWVKEVDDTRFVTIGDNKFKDGLNGWQESRSFAESLTEAGGAVGMNYANGNQFDHFHRNNPNWSIYASETSSAINSRGIYKNTDKLYTSYDTSVVPWGHVAAQSWYFIAPRDFMAGEFIWTGFDYLGEPTNYNKLEPGPHITGWPSPKSSYFGIIDTAGLPKDTFYFYKSQWDDSETTLHILPAWHEDVVTKTLGNVSVNVYSNAKSVELFFQEENSEEKTSLGRKTFDEVITEKNKFKYQIYKGEGKSNKDYENLYLSWSVPYKNGKLTAVAYGKDGQIIEKTVGRSSVETFGAASKIKVSPDRQEIKADGRDLSYITIDIADSKDRIVDNAQNLVNVSVTGDGKLLGLDNGDQRDHERYDSGKRKALSGKLVAIVQAGKNGTGFTLTANSQGLESASVSVNTKVEVKDADEDKPIAYTMVKNYYVKLGSSPELEKSVTLHFKNKEDKVAKVTWGNLSYDKAGNHIVRGSVEGYKFKVQATVSVLDGPIAVLNYSVAIAKDSGKVNLPSTRPIVEKNGKITDVQFPVKWNEQDVGQYKNIGNYVVEGKCNIFGLETNVKAFVRVAETKIEQGENVAPNRLELKQDIPENLQSDNLNSIIDKNINFSSVTNGPNQSVWTNYNSAQTGKKDATITINFATAQILNKAKLYWYQDSWSARMPEKVEIFWSSTGNDSEWTKLEVKEKEGQVSSNSVPNYTPVEYDFDAVSATWVKFVITGKEGKNSQGRANLCLGLTELELHSVNFSFDLSDSAYITKMTINNEDVQKDYSRIREIYTDQNEPISITAESDKNAAITVLPIFDGKIKILTESEDQSKRATYTVNVGKEEPKSNLVDSNSEYKIYPKPHSLTYDAKGVELTPEFNVISEDGLDEATNKRVERLLSDYKIGRASEDAISSTKVNLLLGVKGSGKLVDKYFDQNIAMDNNFSKIDAYQLSIKGNVIAILGKDTDAVFYGLQTLDLILEQAKDKVLRNLEINDYADQQIRGVIEGYYGVPWGWEKRADILKFGSKFKNNAMIFAPKDDPYHRDEWRKLYPEKDLEEISKLAKIGNEYKNRFIWTIAPFHKNPINALNYDKSIEVLKTKLDQLYNAGVRQFGILRDDISSESGYATVSKVMNDLKKWAESKPEKIYDFIFCPYSYTFEGWAWRPYELDEYTKNFPDNVKIFFTGTNVCTPVRGDDFKAYKTKDIKGGRKRKAPLMWLNWPVNDVFKASHGMMGLAMGNPKNILDPNVDVNDIVGVVSNPMQEAYASFVAVFAISDYTWNTGGYNADISYKEGFKYIDPDAYEELEELASHMASVDGTIGIQNLEESAGLKSEIANFERLAVQSDIEKIKESGNLLKAKYTEIVKAVDGFIEKSKFNGLKEELNPYITSLKEKSQASIKFIEAIIALKEGDIDRGGELYKQGQDKLETSRSHKIQVSPKGEMRRVDAGIKRITPNIKNMQLIARGLIEGPSGESDQLLGVNIGRAGQGKYPKAIASWTNDSSVSSGSNDSVDKINDGIKDFEGSSGNRWTNWTREKRPQDWVGIVFGDSSTKKMFVSGIKLGFFEDHGVSKPKSYKIEYYDGPDLEEVTDNQHIDRTDSPLKDDKNWKEVKNLKASNFRLKTMNSISFNKVETYAIRIKMVPEQAMGLAITEFEAYGEKKAQGPFVNPIVTKDNIIKNPDGYYIYQSSRLENMVDGDDSTFTWFGISGDSYSSGHYFGLDLKKEYKLGRFRMVMGGDRKDIFTKYQIKYSSDRVNWKSYGEAYNQTDKQKVIDFVFENVNARYIIVEALAGGNTWVQITEFMVETEDINELDNKPLEEKTIIRQSTESEVEVIKAKLQEENKDTKDLKADFLDITIENRKDENENVNIVLDGEKHLSQNVSLDKDVYVYHVGEQIEKVDGVIANKEDKTVSFFYNKFSPFIVTNMEISEKKEPLPDSEKPNPSEPNKDDDTTRVERIFGENRYETALEVSKKYFDTADTVILARADIYPDALSASILSKVKNAPILLTPSDKMLEVIEKEIERLGAKSVIIVGGERAISKDVEEGLKTYSLERLAGQDRFETSALIARKLAGENDIRKSAIIASGEVWADALAAGSFAGKETHPILLVKKDLIPESISQAIKDLKIEKTYVVGGSRRVGGERAISKDVEEGLKTYSLERLAGQDRFETSALIARKLAGENDIRKSAIIASGEVWADALAAGSFAGKETHPILLVKKDLIPESISQAIKDLKIEKTYVVGGSRRIGEKVKAQLPSIVKEFAGENRFETAGLLAEYGFIDSKKAFLASGESFADSLIIGGLAGKEEAPILLTGKKTLARETQKYLDNSNIEKISIIGGSAKVSEEIKDSLK